jgi:Leucine-rich repeat (LRR) protein
LDANGGGKGSVNRDTLLHYLKSDELPKEIHSPTTLVVAQPQPQPSSTQSSSNIVSREIKLRASEPESPAVPEARKTVIPQRRIIGQNTLRRNNPPPLPSTITSGLRPSPNRRKTQPLDSSIGERSILDDDTIVSPYPSSLRHSKGTKSHLLLLLITPCLSLNLGVESFFPLHDDPNESDQVPTTTSSYADGVLIASSHELTSLEVPDEVLSLIYQRSQSKRRHSSVGVQSIHTIILSHNKISTLQFDKIASFTSLKHLDLSFNLIPSVTPHLFPTHHHLLTLKLNRNHLKSLDGLLLCQSLIELNVAHNEISSTEGLPNNLQKLDLSYNLIDGDLNLRMLSLCTKLVSLNIDQNPVIYRYRHWRGRLFSLLPKLEEINHEIVPKIRKGIVTSSMTKGRGRNGKEAMSMKSSTQRYSSPNRYRSSSISPKKFSLSPQKMKKSEQEAHDLQRYKEYESLRKSREKLEKDKNNLLQSMSKSVHKKPLPEQHLLDLSLRLYNFKPTHVKKLEKIEVC